MVYAKKKLSIKVLRKVFNSFDEIILAILFGSRATKNYNNFSDYDIAILTKNDDILEFSYLWVEIASRLDINDKDLDLINLKKANKFLLDNIKKKYIILKGKKSEFLRLFSSNQR